MENFSKIFIFFLFLCLMMKANAMNLGVHGQLYKIAEEDLLSFIEKKFLNMKKNGEWEKIQKNWQEKMLAVADRPKPINIETTNKPKKFTFDPTIVIKRNIIDLSGNVLIPAGQSINPLQMMPLTKTFLFINGDDENQIKWAKQKIHEFTSSKLILVSGSITKIAKNLKTKVYFDQRGKLIEHFKITHVPAQLKQVGNFLEISEELPG